MSDVNIDWKGRALAAEAETLNLKNLCAHHGICTVCREYYSHHYTEPFATCKCNTSEWYEITEYMKLQDELRKMREQKPVGQVQESSPSDKWPVMRTLGEFPPIGTYLYADPIHAPAVPAEWREVMAELTADVKAACDAEHPHRDQYPSVMRKYNNDMEIVEKARALLQSAEATK